MSKPIRHIAVVSINRDKYSETFIQNSFDYFPCKKTLLYGGYLPTHATTDWRLMGEPIPQAKTPFWKESPKTQAAQEQANLRAWLQQHRPDVVLAHYGPSGVAVWEICAALKIPLVVHFHGYDAYRADILSSQGRLYPELFAHAAALVAVSADMEQQLLDLGAPPSKLHTCLYGVDLAQFPLQPLPQGQTRFLFVGRFVAKKAPDLLLRAFAQLHLAIPEVHLTLVGDGELLPACKELVAELGLGNAVDFAGAVAHAHVADHLARCHALVLPSCRPEGGDSEGTPLVILEAGATGRAVVSTRHGGIPGVVADGVTGILVAEQDFVALAAAMERLARDPELAHRMGLAAHARVQSSFAQARYHENLWRLLNAAVHDRQNS